MHDSENILRLYISSGAYFNNAGRIQLLLSNADIHFNIFYYYHHMLDQCIDIYIIVLSCHFEIQVSYLCSGSRRECF